MNLRELSRLLLPDYSPLKCRRKKGLEVAIYDVPAMQVSAEKAAEAAVTDFDPLLVAITVYGLQPSASTQETWNHAGKICAADQGAAILMSKSS